MNATIRLAFLALFVVALGFRLSPAFAQGSLTPPGAPAPTMRSLSQLGASLDQLPNQVNQVTNLLAQMAGQVAGDARIPISIFGTNLTVPGSYYLTANLFSGTNLSDAIVIRSNLNNITIDLNGFSIVTTNPPNGVSS